MKENREKEKRDYEVIKKQKCGHKFPFLDHHRKSEKLIDKIIRYNKTLRQGA